MHVCMYVTGLDLKHTRFTTHHMSVLIVACICGKEYNKLRGPIYTKTVSLLHDREIN